MVTGLQLDFELLIFTLWVQQFSQFSVHLTVHLSSLCFNILSWGCYRWKCQVPCKINSIHCSPFIHWASHLTVKSCWVSEVWFDFCKFLQLGLFPPFPRDRGETNKTVVPQILLACVEDRSSIYFLPGLRNFLKLPQSFRDDWRVALQWHWPGPSVLMGASHQIPGTCICLVWLNVP